MPFSTINNLYESQLKNRNKNLEKELKDNQPDINKLKKEVEQKGKKLYRMLGTEESIYYSAGIDILSGIETKVESIMNNNGFDDISKRLSLDSKVEVKNAKNKLEETAKEFRKTIDNSWGFGITTSADKMILKVANSIQSANNLFFRQFQIVYNQHVIDENKKNISKISESKLDSQGAGIDENNVFTSESNKLTIHDVIDSSKFSNNDVFILNYDNCSSDSIKKKAKSFSENGLGKLYIEKKEINGVETFVYQGTDQRALVWEGIKISPATKAMLQIQAKSRGQEYKKNKKIEEEQKIKEQMGVLENYSALGINFKNGMNITESQDKEISQKLYTFIESELNRLITGSLNGISVPSKADAPFAGAMTSGKLLVFETIRGQADQYILRKDELQKILGDDLGNKVYKFLDESDNEAQLKSFLNNRWNKLYEERVTKNKNFSVDAKAEGFFVGEDGKTYKKENGQNVEVKLNENQVFVDGLDIDWQTPENAVWIRNKTEAEMEKIVEKINSGKISMPKNVNPFNTNRNFATNGSNDTGAHFIEFEKKGSALDEKVFEFSSFAGKNEIKNIFTSMFNRKKMSDYMNKLWKDKYTNLIKNKKGIEDLSKIEDPVTLNNKIKNYTAEVLDTYKNNNKPNEEQKAELRAKINEISEGLKKLIILVEKMSDGTDKKTIQANIPIYGAKLAEITSGIGGQSTGIADADKLESALVKGDAEKNIQIAIENIDYEIYGKSSQQLIDLYISKHRNINNNFSKIDSFKQNAPAYMNALGTKIFHKIKEQELTSAFTVDQKRGLMFELAQISRDQSSKINIDNKFIDYDLSEEIFEELMIGNGGIINKLNPNDAIRPEHRESMGMTTYQRKSLFIKFPGGDELVKQEWVSKPYKDLSIEQRTMLATYKNYFDRFGEINTQKLESDPTYINLIAKQLVEMTSLTSKFMMDDYSDRLDFKMRNLGFGSTSNTNIVFPGLNDFDTKIAREYIDMKGIGYFNLTDRNTQKFKDYSAMAAVLIAAIVVSIVSWGSVAAPALGAAISTITGTVLTKATALMAANVIISALAGSAVFVAADFAQGKGYENWNEGIVDVSTMTAVFVGTAIVTMGVGNFLNKIPAGLKIVFQSSARRQKIVSGKLLQSGVKTIETAGSGALMGYVESQRQEWLTGESHPEMVIQMMGLAMGMRVMMNGFGGGKSLVEKYIKKGEGNKILENNQKYINELEKGLKDPNTKSEVKPELESQLNNAKANQEKIKNEMNNKNKAESESTNNKVNNKNTMNETQIKEKIIEIDGKIEEIRNGVTDKSSISIENLQYEVNGAKANLNKGPSKKIQNWMEGKQKIINERTNKINELQTEKVKLESQLTNGNQAKNSAESKVEQKTESKTDAENIINAPNNQVLNEGVGNKVIDVAVPKNIQNGQSIDGIKSGDYLISGNKKYKITENKLYEFPSSKNKYLKTIGPDGKPVESIIFGNNSIKVEVTNLENIPKQLKTGAVQNQKMLTPGDVVAPKQLTAGKVNKLLELPMNKNKMLALPPHKPFSPIPNMDVKFPYRLLPIFLLPLDNQNRKNILTKIGIEMDEMIENPAKDGIELDSDITGPYDSRADTGNIKSEIDLKFNELIRRNNIMPPFENNSLILIRGVASWTYGGFGSADTYNEVLAEKRAEEFKRYLMEKYPELTDDNFITGSFHQSDEVPSTDPKRFQGVTMSVIDKSKYDISAGLPTGVDGKVS